MVKQFTVREKGPYSEFLWSYFPAFGLNTDQKTSNKDTFHSVKTDTNQTILQYKSIDSFLLDGEINLKRVNNCKT